MHNNNDGIGAHFSSFLWGAVVGATALALMDKRSRDWIKDHAQNMMEKGEDAKETIKEKFEEGKTAVRNRVNEELQKTRKGVTSRG